MGRRQNRKAKGTEQKSAEGAAKVLLLSSVLAAARCDGEADNHNADTATTKSEETSKSDTLQGLAQSPSLTITCNSGTSQCHDVSLSPEPFDAKNDSQQNLEHPAVDYAHTGARLVTALLELLDRLIVAAVGSDEAECAESMDELERFFNEIVDQVRTSDLADATKACIASLMASLGDSKHSDDARDELEKLKLQCRSEQASHLLLSEELKSKLKALAMSNARLEHDLDRLKTSKSNEVKAPLAENAALKSEISQMTEQFEEAKKDLQASLRRARQSAKESANNLSCLREEADIRTIELQTKLAELTSENDALRKRIFPAVAKFRAKLNRQQHAAAPEQYVHESEKRATLQKKKVTFQVIESVKSQELGAGGQPIGPEPKVAESSGTNAGAVQNQLDPRLSENVSEASSLNRSSAAASVKVFANDGCCICTGDLADGLPINVTLCGHMNHLQVQMCLKQWQQQTNQSCPQCFATGKDS